MKKIQTIISKLIKPMNVVGLGWICLLLFTLHSHFLLLRAGRSEGTEGSGSLGDGIHE
ncbi:MAG: hypothetical protein K5672_07270 [Bacteroidaceae bacterium]|nr:hypothetical protein [Bacteroidaceae bacterium]